MPVPLLNFLATLGAGSQGYNQAEMDQLALKTARLKQLQDQQKQDASGSFMAALQAMVNGQPDGGGGAAPLPLGPGQASVPMTSPTVAPVSSSMGIPPVNASQLSQPPAATSNLPIATPMPKPPQVPMPNVGSAPAASSALPAAGAPPQQNYQDLLKRVVTAVNQAMPNGDPSTKAIVARELMDNVVAQQQQYDQKQAMLGLKTEQLGERERQDMMMDTIRQQLADAASKRAGAEESRADTYKNRPSGGKTGKNLTYDEALHEYSQAESNFRTLSQNPTADSAAVTQAKKAADEAKLALRKAAQGDAGAAPPADGTAAKPATTEDTVTVNPGEPTATAADGGMLVVRNGQWVKAKAQ